MAADDEARDAKTAITFLAAMPSKSRETQVIDPAHLNMHLVTKVSSWLQAVLSGLST